MYIQMIDNLAFVDPFHTELFVASVDTVVLDN